MPQEKDARVVWKQGMAFDGDGWSGHTVAIDDGPSGMSPIELLLISLAGCTAMDIVMILEKQHQLLTGLEVRAHAIRRDEYPRIFTDIHLEYRVEGAQVDPNALEKAIQLSEEKYCTVMGMLNQAARITSSYVLLAENPVSSSN